MCSVVEIKNGSEYYIHYHSPESLDTIWSDGGERSQEYHPLFTRTDHSDLATDKISLTISDFREERDFSLEEIVSDSLIGKQTIHDEDTLVRKVSKDTGDLVSGDKGPEADSGDESRITVSCEEVDDENICEATVVDNVTINTDDIEILETSDNSTQVV